MLRDRESGPQRAQANELNAAEQHEQEAVRQRERAVGHGAHPDHGFLASQNPNRQNLNQGQGLNQDQSYNQVPGYNRGQGQGFNDARAGGAGLDGVDASGRRGPAGAGPTGGNY